MLGSLTRINHAIDIWQPLITTQWLPWFAKPMESNSFRTVAIALAGFVVAASALILMGMVEIRADMALRGGVVSWDNHLATTQRPHVAWYLYLLIGVLGAGVVLFTELPRSVRARSVARISATATSAVILVAAIVLRDPIRVEGYPVGLRGWVEQLANLGAAYLVMVLITVRLVWEFIFTKPERG